MALSDYDKTHLSAEQQAGILAATERYNNATTQAERDAAHADAQNIRASAGYQGSSSGSYGGTSSGGSYSSGGSSSYRSGGTPYSSKMPDMSRNEKLAGKTVYSNGMNVTYNDRGYAVSAVNPNHSLYAGTTRSVHAQPIADALAGRTWAEPDTSGLVAWNDGWGGNYKNGLTYADAYRSGLLANGPSTQSKLYASARNVQSGTATPSGAAGTTGGYEDQLAGLYADGGAYAQALAEMQAANRAAAQSAIAQLERRRQDLNDEYSDLYRQAYIDKMNAMKDINQRLAAQGVTGGAAESTMLGLNADYQNALQEGERSRLGAMQSLDQAITEAQLTGDMKNAQAAMDAAQDQTARYASILQSLLNREDTLRAQEAAQARSEQSEAQAWARQMATQLLAAGNMPDDATLNAAGITRAQALALLAPAEAETSTYTPGFSRAQVMDAYNRAVKAGTSLTGNLLRDYNYYLYGDPDYAGAATSIQAATPSRSGGGVSYDNGGYSPKEIYALQEWLQSQGVKIDADGYWGPASRKAMGGMSAAEAMTAMNEYLSGGGGVSDIPKALVEEINRDAEGGMSPEGLYNVIVGWVNSGKITRDQGNRLAESFGY